MQTDAPMQAHDGAAPQLLGGSTQWTTTPTCVASCTHACPGPHWLQLPTLAHSVASTQPPQHAPATAAVWPDGHVGGSESQATIVWSQGNAATHRPTLHA